LARRKSHRARRKIHRHKELRELIAAVCRRYDIETPPPLEG
jgi:hypothetical protein